MCACVTERTLCEPRIPTHSMGWNMITWIFVLLLLSRYNYRLFGLSQTTSKRHGVQNPQEGKAICLTTGYRRWHTRWIFLGGKYYIKYSKLNKANALKTVRTSRPSDTDYDYHDRPSVDFRSDFLLVHGQLVFCFLWFRA